MRDMKLSTQNRTYVADAPERTKSRDFYGGTAAVKAKGKEYLFKEKNEDEENYRMRLSRAVLDNFVEKIVKARQAVLFQRSHGREIAQKVKDYQTDVDLNGTNASTFFEQVARDAQVDGIRWVLIDMPKSEAPLVSVAAERAAGIRPFFQSVPAEAVIDWEFDVDNQLKWVVIQESLAVPRDTPGEEQIFETSYKVWRRDRWEVWRKPKDANTSEEVIVETGENPTGMVPLVPFYGVYKAPCSGAPVCVSVLDHVLLLYNKQSDLDWFERLSCHPIPYVIGPEIPTKIDANGGLFVKSGPNAGQVEVDYLQTSGAGESSVRASIERLERTIYVIALAQAKRDGKQVQAADSQREDRKIFTSSLTSVSERLEQSEIACWHAAERWLGETKPKSVVTYSRDFDDRSIQETMLTVLSSMVDEKKLTLRTLLRIIEQAEIIPEFRADDEQKALEQQTANKAVSLVRDLKVPSET